MIRITMGGFLVFVGALSLVSFSTNANIKEDLPVGKGILLKLSCKF